MAKKDNVFDSPMPFNISLVAPSGFGKTTFLATLIQEAQNKFTDPKNGMTVVCGNQDDEKRIKQANEELHNAILAGQAGYTKKVSPRLAGSADIKKFTFYLQHQCGDVTVRQPFSIMDIPGGWINSKNRISETMNAKWEEFKEHLHSSRLLFVPIDATLVMEWTTDKERATAVKLLDSNSTNDLIKEWAQYRKGELERTSALFFVPIKCEKYRNKSKELEERVKLFYGNTANQVHDICPHIQQYYIPLETLGCVEFSHGTWEMEEGKEAFQAEFRMAGNGGRRTKNVDQIFSMIASMAGEELQKIKNKLDWKVYGKEVRRSCLASVGSFVLGCVIGVVGVLLGPIGIVLYILYILLLFIINRRHRKEEYSVSPDEIINALLSYKENSGVVARRITWW
ncbi:MAG: hypothetical protein J6R96_00710 [Spirochaetaceae bacterium]|nr:hypothetical protein [Spirochaetaceae bacterium]